MGEREVQRVREAEAQPINVYEVAYAMDAAKRKRADEGKIVIKGSERPWRLSRQGYLKHFLSSALDDTAVTGWRSFMIHDIRTHSGKHRHQGGLAIYALEGKGWTVVDGVRYDWEEEDLILLPLKPGGCEHQHFNAEPGKPCKWLAMIYGSFKEAMGSQMEQVEVHPDWTDHT